MFMRSSPTPVIIRSNLLLTPACCPCVGSDNIWNLNYVTNFRNLDHPTKLLIPSILCTSDRFVRQNWFHAREVTLKSIFLMRLSQGPARSGEQDVVNFPLTFRNAAAKVAERYADKSTVPRPAECCERGSLYKLWTTLKPYNPPFDGATSQMDGRWFKVYFTAIVWGAVLLAGLGSEVVFGNVLMEFIAKAENGFVLWHMSQLIFALFLCVAFTAQDGLGLPFLAAGLWK
jgi:hypothetical protein